MALELFAAKSKLTKPDNTAPVSFTTRGVADDRTEKPNFESLSRFECMATS